MNKSYNHRLREIQELLIFTLLLFAVYESSVIINQQAPAIQAIIPDIQIKIFYEKPRTPQTVSLQTYISPLPSQPRIEPTSGDRSTVDQSGNVYQLKEVGTVFKKILSLRILSMTFFCDTKTHEEQSIDNLAKMIEIKSYVNIKGERIYNKLSNWLNKNLTSEQFIRHETNLANLQKYIQDVAYGDILKIKYLPAEGTGFYLNDSLVGTIENAEFSKYLFDAWIEKNSFDKKIQKQLFSSLDKNQLAFLD